ncbi:MAG: hypothetical protein KKA60_02775 [Proteobacteria bacterium]|nr:hypothetical protein [Pseudomonadota bacterium]
MKYRFILTRNDSKNKLIIREFSQRPDDTTDLLGVREYDSAKVQAALAAGPLALADVIRDERLYPPTSFMFILAEALERLYDPERGEGPELEVEEVDVLPADIRRVEEAAEKKEEDLLDDDDDDDEYAEEDILDEDEDYSSGKILKVEDTEAVADEEPEE